jgi:hypothetical protein
MVPVLGGGMRLRISSRLLLASSNLFLLSSGTNRFTNYDIDKETHQNLMLC